MKEKPSKIYARETIEGIKNLSDAGLIEWEATENVTTVWGTILTCCQAKLGKNLIHTLVRVGRTKHHWLWGDSIVTVFGLEIKKESEKETSTVIITSDSSILPGQEMHESEYLENLVWQVSVVVNRKEKLIDIVDNNLEKIVSVISSNTKT